MIQGYNIVCIGSQDWHAHLNVPQQTMKRLAACNRVLYVNLPRTPLRLVLGDGGGYSARRKKRLEVIRVDDDCLWLYSPPALFVPANGLPGRVSLAATQLNGHILARLLRGVTSNLMFDAPLLWIYAFGGAPLLGKISARLTVYDCIDDWPGYLPNGTTRENVSRLDSTLCRAADLVFVGSKPLLAARRDLNPETHWVPHAADFSHFSLAASEHTPIPADISGIPRPIVGLIGMLEKRVDLDILSHLAGARPEWSIVLVGPVWNSLDISSLQRHRNVHFLGMKPVAELPGYLKAFDVCMVPYVLDDFTRAIYPLKLHEYLASGKPIVSTRIPAIAEHEELIYIADGPQEFAGAVHRALGERDPQLSRRRIQLASQNTWEDRVARKSALVEKLLARRSGAAASMTDNKRDWST